MTSSKHTAENCIASVLGRLSTEEAQQVIANIKLSVEIERANAVIDALEDQRRRTLAIINEGFGPLSEERIHDPG